MTDKDRLDGIAGLVKRGLCPILAFDDRKYWALGSDGTQNCVSRKSDIIGQYYIPKRHWKKTIRKAIDYGLRTL